MHVKVEINIMSVILSFYPGSTRKSGSEKLDCLLFFIIFYYSSDIKVNNYLNTLTTYTSFSLV